MRRTITLTATVLMVHGLSAQTWQQTNGPYGGDIGVLAAPSPGIVLAVAQNEVYRSTNNGERWAKVPDLPGLGYLGVSSFSHAASGYTFAASGGVHRSSNNGQSWEPINEGLVSWVDQIAAGGGGQVFACGRYMFGSTDNGNTWTQLNIGFAETNGCFSLAVSPGGTVFAGILASSTHALLRSTNGGATWAIVSGERYVRTVAFNKSGHVFIGSDFHGALRSTDNGNTWVEINAGLPGPPQAGWIRSIVVDGNGQLFAGTMHGAFRSTNSGDSWTPANVGMGDRYVLSLAIDSAGTMFAGTLNGIFRTTNGGNSWQLFNAGITDYTITALAKNSIGHILAGSQNGRTLFCSTDEGNSWVDISDETQMPVVSIVVNARQHIFAGCGQAGVFRSTDHGNTWTHLTMPAFWVSSVAINMSGHAFAGVYDPWFGEGAVFRSTDNGEVWTRVDSGMSSVFTVVVAESGHILAGTRTGVYRSTNNGDTWLHLSSSPQHIRQLVRNAFGHIFVGTYNNGMFRSLDDGQNWTAISSGLPSPYVTALAVDESGRIFAGLGTSSPFRGEGVFQSTDNGDTWNSINQGFADLNVKSLLVGSNGRIFAGTSVEGVFSRSGPTGVGETSEQLPGVFILDQNYPNPFNPTTRIKFTLSSQERDGVRSYVSLKVYDVLGREVRTLVSEDLQPGSYEVTFNAEGLASGTYFYKLQAGTFAQTKKLLLLR